MLTRRCEPVLLPGSARSARVTSQWNGKNLHPNPTEVGPGAENLPLISPLAAPMKPYTKEESNGENPGPSYARS